LLFNPNVLVEHTFPIVVIASAVIIGKMVSCSIGAFISGQDGRTSLRVGMGLAQIGEFSFIIASLGISLKVTSDFLYPIAVAVAAVTALTTPFFMKSADGVSKQVARVIPQSISEVANAYTLWLQSIQPQGDSVVIAKIIRRIVIHVLVNFAVVIAIFLMSAYFVDVLEKHLPILIIHEGLEKTVVWSGALLLALPFLIAAYRKLKALSMLLAEMSAGNYSMQTRKVISEVIPIVAILVMLLLVSALSASILPPVNLLLAVLGLFAVLVPLLWGRFVKLHSRLQIALIETLDEDEQSH
jgi:CPA2 family monovalent cation:H+ antiporter-2